MKREPTNQIKQARARAVSKSIDVVVSPAAVDQPQVRTAAPTRRKRRINYAKKIMNDPFIFSV